MNESTKSKTNESSFVHLEPPRFENGAPLLIAGLRAQLAAGTNQIPAQWQRLGPYIGKVPGQVGGVFYGVGFNISEDQDGCDYLSGFEVSDFSGIPGELSRVSIPAQRYAVFPHHGHVSKLYNTINTIHRQWLPGSGCQVANDNAGAVAFFEHYGEKFDPQTGTGGIEVWIPIKA
jgi:AraC family transcriptional regulator